MSRIPKPNVGTLLIACVVTFLVQLHAVRADVVKPVIPVLVYHSIFRDHPGQTADQRVYQITPEEFDAQLSYIEQNGYTVVTLGQAIAAEEQGTTTKKIIAITFDDGWWNQYAYGLPLLIKHHMHATFYIFPNPVGKSIFFMDWNQVRMLVADGMEIGSHSFTHPHFSLLTTVQLQKELAVSKSKLESEIGRPVTLFASPFGYTNPEITQLVKSNGYTSNRLLGGTVLASTTDLYTLRGYLVTRDMDGFKKVVQMSR